MGAVFRVLLLLILASIPAAAYADCAIPTENGLIPDRDCDGLDDTLDNCPDIANSEQYDANRNLIGDACDLIISEITIHPGTTLEQGAIFTAKVQLQNNQKEPISIDVSITNEELKINVETNENLAAGQTTILDFPLKIPSCARTRSHELKISTEREIGRATSVENQYQPIKIIEGNCGEETLLDNTLLETILFQEAIAGESVIYPISILNMNSKAMTYRVSLEADSLATYRLEPNQSINIASGKKEYLYLHVQTYEEAEPGRHRISILLESDGEVERIPVGLRILQEIEEAPIEDLFLSALEIALILLVIALIIGSIVVAYLRSGESK